MYTVWLDDLYNYNTAVLLNDMHISGGRIYAFYIWKELKEKLVTKAYCDHIVCSIPSVIGLIPAYYWLPTLTSARIYYSAVVTQNYIFIDPILGLYRVSICYWPNIAPMCKIYPTHFAWLVFGQYLHIILVIIFPRTVSDEGRFLSVNKSLVRV